MKIIKQILLVSLLTACLVVSVSAKEKKTKKVYAGREIWLPDSWNDAKMEVVNGKFQYTPPSPNFKKKRLGVIGSASEVGLKKGIKLRKVPPNSFIKDKENEVHKVQQAKIYKINGKLFKAIGEYRGCVYFKGQEKNQYIRAEIIDIKKYLAEKKKQKKKSKK